MRKVTLIGLVIVLALSLMTAGTILAQGGRGGRGPTTWLGANITDTEDGVVVTEISADSPAETGGLLVDDIIVSVDEQAIDSAADLTSVIRSYEPGDVVVIRVVRDDGENMFEITLGTSSSGKPGDISADADPLVMAERVLRVELAEVDAGYQVIDSRTSAEDTLVVDDIITAVNETPIAEVNWQTLLTELADLDEPVLSLTVLRTEEELTIDLEQFGVIRDRQPMGDLDRPGRNNHDHSNQFGSSDNQGTQGETAPHEVEPGTTCDQCHGGGSSTSSPSLDTSADSPAT